MKYVYAIIGGILGASVFFFLGYFCVEYFSIDRGSEIYQGLLSMPFAGGIGAGTYAYENYKNKQQNKTAIKRRRAQ